MTRNNKKSHPSEDPRKCAVDVLTRFDKRQDPIDHIIENHIDTHQLLSPLDRAFFNLLVFGVLRQRGRLDWIIGQFSTTPVNRIEARVLNILRIGLYQLYHMDRVPASAAVNTSVNLAKAKSAPWISKFVNGLLRNIIRRYDEMSWPDRDTDPVLSISIEKSFPEWLIERWLPRFGLENTLLLCNRMNTIPTLSVRINSLMADRSGVAGELGKQVSNIKLSELVPCGLLLEKPGMPIDHLSAYQKGMFQIQDEAAQMVGLLLNAEPGETVLDACCGLGGKTGHIAMQMEDKGRIIAVDNRDNKLMKLRVEMNRLGVNCVTTEIMDLNNANALRAIGTADRVLLDAPCSGLGVIRRNPDTKWVSSKKDLLKYQRRQLTFLENLSTVVKEGGSLVFSVCSFEPEENEQVVESFLKKHKEFAIVPPSDHFSLAPKNITDSNGYLRTFPHLHDTDGFFAVELKRCH